MLVNTNILVYFLLALIIVVLLWTLFQEWRFWRLKKKLKTFLQGKRGKDLQEIILKQEKHLLRAENDIKEIYKAIDLLDRRILRNIQKVRIMRFNPFRELGGNQSFCIAMLDAKNNGFVLSTLYTKDGTRIFAKVINKGISETKLSREEEEVLQKAIKEEEEIKS